MSVRMCVNAVIGVTKKTKPKSSGLAHLTPHMIHDSKPGVNLGETGSHNFGKGDNNMGLGPRSLFRA